MNDSKPERIPLRDSLAFTIKAAITDASAFSQYVLKEYAPKCQGPLAISKSPAKHTLENCLYDEICGWLDTPTITGVSILSIEVGPPAFKNHILNEEPRVNFREFIDLGYDICKLETSAKKNSNFVLVDRERLEQLKQRAKWLLEHADKVEFHESKPQKTSRQVGNSLRERRLPGGLPTPP
jgi:hypothetical protein